ncbi:hypothetical protein TTHERM_00294630 (macronuclear) [Tetrahymena thermophila SB210]|uniref:Uncharacterized protein n=1 Tax=Tetrahymena thermophila (strain SB210) TaxID=312017 RepID=I7M0W7_TETTS|nr:hypothetical protein TTHERM_00294630 [Tetrahymena thermophila SB210]EAR92850.2 hypothetical protein TTHERM_00294630 [Tetrahymena thermophila SB210]|eukprot:XP_001013095.2 hypothetical protein TTHERM_00294630 [Tetrahymena thermophila SB210]
MSSTDKSYKRHKVEAIPLTFAFDKKIHPDEYKNYISINQNRENKQIGVLHNAISSLIQKQRPRLQDEFEKSNNFRLSQDFGNQSTLRSDTNKKRVDTIYLPSTSIYLTSKNSPSRMESNQKLYIPYDNSAYTTPKNKSKDITLGIMERRNNDLLMNQQSQQFSSLGDKISTNQSSPLNKTTIMKNYSLDHYQKPQLIGNYNVQKRSKSSYVDQLENNNSLSKNQSSIEQDQLELCKKKCKINPEDTFSQVIKKNKDRNDILNYYLRDLRKKSEQHDYGKDYIQKKDSIKKTQLFSKPAFQEIELEKMIEYENEIDFRKQTQQTKFNEFQDRFQNVKIEKKMSNVLQSFYLAKKNKETMNKDSSINKSIQEMQQNRSRLNSLENNVSKKSVNNSNYQCYFNAQPHQAEQIKNVAKESIKQLQEYFKKFSNNLESRGVLNDQINKLRVESLYYARKNKIQRSLEEKYGQITDSIFSGEYQFRPKKYNSKKEFSQHLIDVITKPNYQMGFNNNSSNNNINQHTQNETHSKNFLPSTSIKKS